MTATTTDGRSTQFRARGPRAGSRRTSNRAAERPSRAGRAATDDARGASPSRAGPAAPALRRRLRRDHLSRPSTAGGGSPPRTSGRSARRRADYVTPDLGVAGGVTFGADRPLDAGPRVAGVPRAAHPEDPLGRGDLVPVLLRARGRLGPRRHPHPGDCATATTGSSTGRRSGAAAPTTPTGRCAWPAPTGTCPSTAGLTWFAVPTDAEGRHGQPDHARSTATPSSARSSSTTSIVTDDDVIGEVNRRLGRHPDDARLRARRGHRPRRRWAAGSGGLRQRRRRPDRRGRRRRRPARA